MVGVGPVARVYAFHEGAFESLTAWFGFLTGTPQRSATGGLQETFYADSAYTHCCGFKTHCWTRWWHQVNGVDCRESVPVFGSRSMHRRNKITFHVHLSLARDAALEAEIPRWGSFKLLRIIFLDGSLKTMDIISIVSNLLEFRGISMHSSNPLST